MQAILIFIFFKNFEKKTRHLIIFQAMSEDKSDEWFAKMEARKQRMEEAQAAKKD